MRRRGKKYSAARAQIAADRVYTIQDAIPLVQKVKFAKFDETVELTLRLVDLCDTKIKNFRMDAHGCAQQHYVVALQIPMNDVL